MNGSCNCGFEGWRGELCENRGCPGWGEDCTGHGTCNSATGKCTCDEKWTGTGCEKPDCPGTPDCNGNGNCVKANIPYCKCHKKWMGSACEIPCIHGDVRQTADGQFVCDCHSCFSGISCDIECSGRGNCTNGTCDCGFDGWRGPACETKGCPGWHKDCTGHGSCISALGVCMCRPGWRGRGCHIPQCPGGGNCSGHGVCDGMHNDPPICISCDPGYMGIDCGMPCKHGNVTKILNKETCVCDSCHTGVSCDKECDQHGSCIADHCKCDTGWRGAKCQRVGCPGIGTDCSNHGVCLTVTQQCDCYRGWKGDGCETPDCPGIPDCNNKGDCDGSFNPPRCTNCSRGTMGVGCELPCIHGIEYPPRSSICKCHPCFEGLACDIECSGKGTCSNSTCTCQQGRKGSYCHLLDCPGEPDCTNHGICVQQGNQLPICLCNQGFDGADCSRLVCPGTPMCNNRGNCTLIGKTPQCLCRNEFQGVSCEMCKPRYTGSECERCVTNYIGWKGSCDIYCIHGDATGRDGDKCTCHDNSIQGHWNGSTCEECVTGYAMPTCDHCDVAHVGTKCDIDCMTTNAMYKDYRDGYLGNNAIIPFLHCFKKFSNGTVVVWFGYDNKNSHNVYINVGPDNQFTRASPPSGIADFVKIANREGSVTALPDLASPNLGQTTKFQPGTHNYSFSVR